MLSTKKNKKLAKSRFLSGKKLLFISTLLLSTSILAQPWYEIPVSTNEKLNAIDFPTSNVGYIAGNAGTLLKSIDGGETWNQINFAGIPLIAGSYNFLDVEFIDESIGYITLGQYEGFYKTTNGGATWTAIDDPNWGSFCYRNSVHVFNENSILVGGAGCFQSAMIKKYDDPVWSDATVNYESFNSSESVVDFDFYDVNLGLAATNGQYMLRTTDAGITWDTISTGISPTGVLTSVLFMDNLLCYAGYDENGTGFGILKSTDGGLSWAQDLSSATFYYPAYNSVIKANNGELYSGASSGDIGLIFETANGVDWNYFEVDHPVYAMDSYDNDVTFAVGDSGLVVVNSPISNLSIGEVEKTKNLLLFPNPVTDILTIQSTSVNVISVVLRDLTGRQVSGEIQLNGTLAQFDMSHLSSGAYFLQSLESSDEKVYRIIKQY